MSANLIIVESPSKAKTLKKYLSTDYDVLASYGHIRDLVSKEGAVDPDNEFLMKYAAVPKSKKYIRDILNTANKSEKVFLATDPDREGEAIAWHIAEILLEKKILTEKDLHRIVFYEITKNAVLNAIQQPRKISMDLVNAQQARRALDHLVGFNISPLLWKKIGRNLSAGRVQSPALRLIVEKEQEIEKFTSKEYWTVDVALSKDNFSFNAKLTTFNGEKLKQFSIPNETKFEIVKKAIERNGKGFLYVDSVEKKPKSRYPLPPFTTSTLQQTAVNKLNFSAKEAMSIAQQLYEGVEIDGVNVGLISYMRTDSTNLSNDVQKQIRDYIKQNFSKEYLPEKPTFFKNKSKNAQEAHEAIRPTLIQRRPDKIKKFLSISQYALYDLIWKRTVACQMSKSISDITTIDFYINQNKDIIFRSSGNVLIFDGFLKIYADSNPDNLDSSQVNLPPLEINERVKLEKLKGDQHFTLPPARFSEASLVKTLEEHGIGRPSTYATIISTLQDRGYALLEKKKFFPSDTGRIVNGFLKEHFSSYVDYDFTAKLEEDLDEISNGNNNWKFVLKTFWNNFYNNVQTKLDVNRGIPVPNKTPPARDWKSFSIVEKDCSIEYCPECSKKNIKSILLLQNSSRGLFVGCSNYPECKFTEPFGFGANIKEPLCLGFSTDYNNEIFLMTGPYGPYVQIGKESDKNKKPKRASWPKTHKLPDPDNLDISLPIAIKVLSLPRLLGKHPKTHKEIAVNIGRFGPYIKHDGSFRSIPKSANNVYEIELDEALEILSKPINSKLSGKLVGIDPKSKNKIFLKSGRFGTYLKVGKKNFSVPKDVKEEDITLKNALNFMTEKKQNK